MPKKPIPRTQRKRGDEKRRSTSKRSEHRGDEKRRTTSKRSEQRGGTAGRGDAPRGKGWVKRDQVWRSDKAQTTAGTEPKPRERSVPPKGTARGRAPRSSPRPPTEDDRHAATAIARKGPGGYEKFGDIPAHKLGRGLRTTLYELANRLPQDERDNLVARIKSAATLVTASLATGFGEGTFRAGVSRALESRGALLAIQDHLEQLADLQLIPEDERDRLRQEVDGVVSAVNDYLGRLTRERNKGRPDS